VIVTDACVTMRPASNAVVSVELSGVIDGSAASQLQHVLVDALMRQRPSQVLVDLRDARFLDAVAIGVLLAAVDTADDLRVVLSVCNPSPDLAAQLNTCGLRLS
jgi:anti-anti-sigma factor